MHNLTEKFDQNWPQLALLCLTASVLLPWWLCLPLALLPTLASRWRLSLACLLLAGWGQLRSLPDLDPLADNRGQPADVVVRVVESPQNTGFGCRFVATVVHWVDRVDGFEGRWLVECQQPADQVALGDRWHLKGRLVGLEGQAYPGGWDARSYWQHRGVTQRLRAQEATFVRPVQVHDVWTAAYHWRYRLTQRLSDRLKPDRAGLLAAVVYGDGSRLSADQSRWFRSAGVSHLLVASGANVALLVAALAGLGRLLGWSPRRCAGLGLLLVPGYVALAGASPSMIRAGAMGWLGLLALWTGYSLNLGRNLALGCLAVLVWDPQFAHDLGFQLSFAAVASLAWLQPLLHSWLPQTLPGRAAVQATLACTLGLVPLSLYTFRTLQPLAPLSNLWMGPLVEGLLPVGLVWSLLDLCHPALGRMAGLLLDPWLWFVQVSVKFWAEVCPSCQVPNPGPWGWLAWASLLGLLYLGPRPRTLQASACLILLTLLCLPLPHQGLRIRLLQLGDSPALWIQEGAQHCLLLSNTRQHRLVLSLQLSQGIAQFEPIYVLGEEHEEQRGWGEGWLQRTPDQLLYHRGPARFGLCHPGQVDGLTWGVDSSGQWGWGGEPAEPLQKGEAWQIVGQQVDEWSLSRWR